MVGDVGTHEYFDMFDILCMVHCTVCLAFLPPKNCACFFVLFCLLLKCSFWCLYLGSLSLHVRWMFCGGKYFLLNFARTAFSCYVHTMSVYKEYRESLTLNFKEKIYDKIFDNCQIFQICYFSWLANKDIDSMEWLCSHICQYLV